MAKASSGVTGCFGCALALDCITATLAGLMKTFGAGGEGGGYAFGGVFGAAEEGAGVATPMGGGGGGGIGGAGPPVVCQSPLKLPSFQARRASRGFILPRFFFSFITSNSTQVQNMLQLEVQTQTV